MKGFYDPPLIATLQSMSIPTSCEERKGYVVKGVSLVFMVVARAIIERLPLRACLVKVKVGLGGAKSASAYRE